MAQQIHYPSDPLQPGPIYFLTPWKCAIFGTCGEALQTNMKGFQHFLFDCTSRSYVSCKLESDSDEEVVSLTMVVSKSPDQIVPTGLPLERQWYLFNSIQEYYPHEVKDKVCPEPTSPLPSSSTPLPFTSTATSLMPTPTQSIRTCTSHNQHPPLITQQREFVIAADAKSLATQ